jgi:hypothetical protein
MKINSAEISAVGPNIDPTCLVDETLLEALTGRTSSINRLLPRSLQYSTATSQRPKIDVYFTLLAMRPIHIITLFLGAAAHVNACIRVHARHFQAPWPEKDGLSIEIWDDHHTYYRCPSCVWTSYSDQNCKVQCNQFTIELGNYGRGGRVTNTLNGYTATLQPHTVANPKSWCCLFGENGACRGRCQVWDNCNWDAFGNCNEYACRLCGGKEICGIRDKRDLPVGDGDDYNSTFLDPGEFFAYTVDGDSAP